MDGKKPVLVTTKHRGVFFGFVEPKEAFKQSLTLHGVRNCIYWSKDVGGFLGLASTGPTDGCRIGKQAPSALLHGVTSVTDCTEAAVKAWTGK